MIGKKFTLPVKKSRQKTGSMQTSLSVEKTKLVARRGRKARGLDEITGLPEK
jgi:hypothetical protein